MSNLHRPRPKRGRPLDPKRQDALQSGLVFYHGVECRKGHKGERYASTGACVACYADRRAVVDEYAQMFD